MLDSFKGIFKKFNKKDSEQLNSGDAAKERLHMVLMQDRANVSADYIDLMKQDIIDDIKKYVDVDEKEIDVRLTNQIKNDGSNGAPALYANIPITGIKNDKKQEHKINSVGNNSKKKVAVKNSILAANTTDLLESKKSQEVKDTVKSVKKTVTKKSSLDGEKAEVVSTARKTTGTKAVTAAKSVTATKTVATKKKRTAAQISDGSAEEKTKAKASTKTTKTTKTTKNAGTKNVG